MKKIIIILHILLLFIVSAKSQDIDSLIARDFANAMRDSLKLTEKETENTFQIDFQSRQEKRKVWEKYRNTPELQSLMNVQDNRKDSLFRTTVGDEKYRQYKNNRKQAFITR